MIFPDWAAIKCRFKARPQAYIETYTKYSKPETVSINFYHLQQAKIDRFHEYLQIKNATYTSVLLTRFCCLCVFDRSTNWDKKQRDMDVYSKFMKFNNPVL